MEENIDDGTFARNGEWTETSTSKSSVGTGTIVQTLLNVQYLKQLSSLKLK